jgi:hypothetical protein
MYAELHDTPTHAKPRVKVRVRAHAHLRERALPRALGQVWPSAGGCKTASRKKFISSRRVSRVRCARVITEPREFAIVLIIIVSGQTVNRFAYVMNNPLSYTDPSGYFSWRKFLGKTIIRIVAAVADAFGCSGYCSMAVNAYYGYKSGGIIGLVASFVPGLNDNTLGRMAVGCLSAVSTGGSCGRGAVAVEARSWGGDGLIGQMLAGCIASRIGGGKCGDGAADSLGSFAVQHLTKGMVRRDQDTQQSSNGDSFNNEDGEAAEYAMDTCMSCEGSMQMVSGGVDKYVIYERIGPGGERYVGHALADRFDARQAEHDRATGRDNRYKVIDRLEGTRETARLHEETHIRRNGGLNELENRRYEMNDKRYKALGGNEPKPNARSGGSSRGGGGGKGGGGGGGGIRNPSWMFQRYDI